MAYHAFAEGIRRAREVGAQQVMGVGVVGTCWLLLRQGRFDECSAVAIATAEGFEPKMSEVEANRVVVWGELWMAVAAASIRDNRPADAKHARKMVDRAAAGMAREVHDFPSHWGNFGPVTAAIKKLEDRAIVGDVRGVLARLNDDVLNPKALKKVGMPSGSDWERHRLDVASAYAAVGSHVEATEELTTAMTSRPEWIKHQTLAREIMVDILGSRKRTLTQEMRTLAAHLEVTG